ncbi:uncharacterized protein LOC121839945 [Oncorhynchus tshawytscha]|uniref:uncharacterized protein LOC121839945 n=1 Tax=Oncorhynchus tshawytscha TaxID=74940 RepID=UPI001C3E6AE1|nr:uncharacterized protein LOC121839945 [Oncorhynchus tshawytscha]
MGVTQVLCVEGSPFCALRSRVRATQALCFQGSRSALAGQSDRASHWLARRVPLSVVECLRVSASVARLCPAPALRYVLCPRRSALSERPRPCVSRALRFALAGQSDRASHWLARRVPLSVVESLRVWRGCALGSPLCALCSVLCALRSRVRATLPASGEACAVARSRVSTSVARLCSGLTALRSGLWALLSWVRAQSQPAGRCTAQRTRSAPPIGHGRAFTAAQVLEQILSSVDQEDYSDCQEEEEEEVSEDEDGEEYNPERRGSTMPLLPLLRKSSSPRKSRPRTATRKRSPRPRTDGSRRCCRRTAKSSGPRGLRPPPRPLAICRAGPDQTPGPTAYAATQARDIASAFHLFVTPAIERIIVEMTNLHGARKYGDGWRPMDATDLRAYLGLLILAGVYRSRGEAAASLWDAESGRTVFRATMSLKVFHRYSRLLRFDDRQSRPARLATDKLAAIREVWDLWEARLPALYNPGPDVTVDEQLVPFRGRCPFRQYIPSKPAKYGIKSWVACDAKSSYAWKMQVYTGKAAGGGPEKNQGMRVVLDLTTGLSGRNVTCDNFFTSYDLGQRLLERNLTMVGTVRRNKAELPPALLESRGRQVLSSRFAFTPTATLVSYLAKRNKNVLLLSTLHTEGHISDRRDMKPALILDYNCNKGGVDNLDKVVGTYSCRRMTARWPLVVFHNILDVSSYNAFVIWREIKPDWMPGKRNKRRVFLEQLGKALVKPLIQRRQHLPRTEAASALVKVLQSATAAPPDQQSQGPAAGTAAARPLPGHHRGK